MRGVKEKIKGIWLALNLAGLIALIVARGLGLYIALRTKLGYARWRQKRRFAATLRREGLPRGLVDELAAEYARTIERELRVPGIRDVLGYSYKRGGKQ